MGAIFGSTDEGYRPKESAERLGGALESALNVGQFTPTRSYTFKGKPIDAKQYESLKSRGMFDKDLGMTETPATYQSKPDFTFQPGESGTDVRGQNISYDPQGYQGFDFTTPQLENKVDPYYAGIENQAIEGAKMGAETGMEQVAAATGRRGLSPRGGTAGRNMGGVAQGLSRDIAGIRRDVGMQRAQQLQGLAERQAQMDMQTQQQQAAEGRFGAGFGQAERQFGVGLQQQQQQQRLRELGLQSDLDRAYRQEKLGLQRMPMEDMMRMYGIQAPLGSRDIKKKGLLDYAGQAGQAAFGIGTGLGAF